MSFFFLRFFKDGFLSAHPANRQKFPPRLGSEPKKPRRRVERNGLTRGKLRGGSSKWPPRWNFQHPHRAFLDLFGSVRPASPLLPSSSFLPSFPPSGETKTKRSENENEARRSERRSEAKRNEATLPLLLYSPLHSGRTEPKRSKTTL